MTTTGSLKAEWDLDKRVRFQRDLQKQGWEVYRTLKESTIFQKNATRIEVDPWGAWLYEFKITDNGGGFVRTQGLSDDRIDRGYTVGYDPNILSFKQDRIVKRFSLATGEWVKK